MNHENAIAVEKKIADAIGPMIRELLLVEPSDYVMYLNLGKHAEVADLVSSASEQFFAPGFIEYREAGYTTLEWETTPRVHLQMVINTPHQMFEFTLSLESKSAIIKLNDRFGCASDIKTGQARSAIFRAFELNQIGGCESSADIS